MSENECRGRRDFSRFDSMSTGELQAILRQDALEEGVESDTEKILYITEVLVKRNRENGSRIDVQKAYASFVENYMPQEEAPEAAPRVLRFPRWLRSAAVVAVAAAALFCGIASASAGGYDLFGMVANWTAEVFHFSSETEGTEFVDPEQGKSTEFANLQEALDKYKIEQKLVPTWIPEGFELSFINVSDTPFEVSFFAMYLKEDNLIEISIRQMDNGNPEQIEKNETYVEVYEVNGVAYHIFRNATYVQAVWTIDEFEGIIAGELTIEEVKSMIDSI